MVKNNKLHCPMPISFEIYNYHKMSIRNGVTGHRLILDGTRLKREVKVSEKNV